jgi:hypothetical protein
MINLTNHTNNAENEYYGKVYLPKLVEIVLLKYPGKISFLAGILKRFYKYDNNSIKDSIIGPILPTYLLNNIDIKDWSQNVLKQPSLNTIEDISKAYLVYRLTRYDLNLV